ncbi:MAG: precorrin-6A/cobalt-precorrin-6A reductase [Flavobacteriaceae bacterium]|nr:precorrin-6A/cobalt-precorrin-6A reductase [Flavobacteriaceae bacterium]
MILVFGGTTEGKQVIKLLDGLQIPYFYSTKTEIKVTLGSTGIYRFGAFSNAVLAQFIKEHQIEYCIHASHPFATVLHETVAEEFEKQHLSVLRLEREYPKRSTSNGVHYVANYSEAILLLETSFSKKTLLGLTGVQTIEKLEHYWETNPSYFRILDRKSSIDIAVKSNYPLAQLILGYANTTVEEEVTLYIDKKIGVILTKESGNSGSLQVKIDAAKELNLPIIIIKKPDLPRYFKSVKCIEELESLLKTNTLCP